MTRRGSRLLRERSARSRRSRETLGSLRAALAEHVLSEIPSVVYTCDPRKPYPTTFITDNVLDEFGYEPADVLADGEFWVDRIVPDNQGAVRSGLEHLGEGPVSLEYRFRCEDGTHRWLRDTVKLVRGTDGEPDEIVGCIIDITDRKRIEESLEAAQATLEERVADRTAELRRANEELETEIAKRGRAEEALFESNVRLRQIAENIHGVFWLYDWNRRRLIYVSPTFETVWRRSPESLLGGDFDWGDTVHEEDRARALQSFESRVAGGEFDETYRIVRPDGSIRWIHDRGVPIEDEEGRVYRIAGCAQDVTLRHETEESVARAQDELERLVRERTTDLRELNEQLGREIVGRKSTEARLRSITDNAPSFILQVDRDGKIEYINRTLQHLSRDEVIGSSVYDWQPPQYHDRARAALRRVFETGQPTSYEVEASGEKPGEVVWYASRVAPVFVDGEVKRAVMISDDVSERKKIEHFEEQVRELQHEVEHATRLSTVGEMSASIAHELNQPLAAIVHYNGACIELLSSARKLHREVLRNNLDAASQQALRAGDIIKRLRAYTSKREPHRSTLDINDAVTEVLALLGLDRTARAVPVELDLDGMSPVVLVDRIQLQQVLINLIRNAMEATEERNGPQPTVRVETAVVAGGRVRVSVSDDGPGLPAGGLEAVVEPFFTTKAGGMGLGLTIAKSIVEDNRGTFGACNRTSGGATFWFELPGAESG